MPPKKKHEDHDIQLSEEEIEEERQHVAATKIQTFYRSKLARDLLKEQIRQTYVKIKDRESHLVFYKNKTTGEISQIKPKALGNSDLPTPRNFVCPSAYDPGDDDGLGLALLVTVSTFSNPKIKPLPKEVDADHGLFEHILSHDFICKFRIENTIILKNPTKAIFIDALLRLKRMSKKKNNIFIYLCTQAVTINTNEIKDDGFFCFKDTSWKDSKSAAMSALSVTEFSRLLSECPAEKKVVALNVVHSRPTPKSIFRSRYLYPPPDLYTRLSDLGDCTVIASCNIGTTTADMTAHAPSSRQTLVRRGALRADMGVVQTEAQSHDSHFHHHKHSHNHNVQTKLIDSNENIQVVDAVAKREFKGGELVTYQQKWIDDKKKKDSDPKPILPKISWSQSTSTTNNNKMMKSTETETITKTNDDNKKSKNSNKKKEESKEVEEKKHDDGNEKKEEKEGEVDDEDTGPKRKKAVIVEKLPPLQLTLPSDGEFLRYKVKLYSWSARQKIYPVVGFVKGVYNGLHKKISASPMQWGKVIERYTLFGKCVADGMSSQMPPPVSMDSSHITVDLLYDYIKENMQKLAIEHAKEVEEHIKDTLDLGKHSLEAEEVVEDHHQNPVFFVPKNSVAMSSGHSSFPVCLFCGPPASPQAPYVIKTNQSSVLLEWILPPFDGIPPKKFKIYMRNNTRLYYNWTVVPGADSVLPQSVKWGANRYLVCHLPMGVPVEFAVAAYNYGGWSTLSKESVTVIPGEEFLPSTVNGQWRRITRGGPLAVLDRLHDFPLHRGEHIIGMRQLIAFAQKEGNGFSRMNIREKCCTLVMHCFKTFPLDPEIYRAAFLLLGYSIQGKTQRTLRMHCIREGLLDIVDNSLKLFRDDTEVISGILWLKKALPNDIVDIGVSKKVHIDGTVDRVDEVKK